MNKVSSLVLVLVIISACVVCGNNVTVQAQDEIPVAFPDENLEAAIREAIDKPEGLIFTSDLDRLTSLKTKGITDLTGLEYCSNLTELVLDYNRIRNLAPLASLTNLTALDLEWSGLSGDSIIDLSPLQNLTKLTRLHLLGSRNQISDISPLASLTNLTDLYLHSNQIGDLAPLASLTNLTVLNLQWSGRSGTQITDLSPLQSLTELTELYLSLYQISDLSPLASLTNLTELYLSRNQISDISPLASLTNLAELYLDGNQISDISPLASLTNLTELYLSWNQISDISPLLSLPNLRTLGIRHGNPLSETSLKVYIPQLRKGGVSIPRPKTSLGYLNIGHLLIPLFVLVAALVAVLLGYPTQHERRARRRRKWLVAGVIVAGLYTFCALVAVAAGGMQPIDLEDLLLFVVAPGLFLYGGVAVAWFLWSRKERKQQHKGEPE